MSSTTHQPNKPNKPNHVHNRSFLEVEGYDGRVEVTPGCEWFVQSVLKKYANVNSGVKIERASNYVGTYQDQPPNAKKKNRKK